MANGYGAYHHGGSDVKEWGENSTPWPGFGNPLFKTLVDPPPWALYTAAGDAFPVLSVDDLGNLYVYGVLIGGISGNITLAGGIDFLGPSGDTTGATDTANIEAALIGFPRRHVILGPGTFYIDAPITPQNNTWLQGSGNQTTTIQQSSTFTGAYMYLAPLAGTISDLQLKAPSGTTANNVAADGIYFTQNGGNVSNLTVNNVNFANLNGWQIHIYDDGTHGAPVNTRIFNCNDGGNNSGGYGIFGAQRTMNFLISNSNANANGGTVTTYDGLYVQDVFDFHVMASLFGGGNQTNTGNAIHLDGHCALGRFVQAEIGGVSTAGSYGIQFTDNANGGSKEITFIGYIIESYQSAVDIEGSSSDVAFTACEFNNNVSHGVIVNSTGNGIYFYGSRWAVAGGINGQGATGSNYDINWTGTANGGVYGCALDSSISSIGTKGVQESVNIAARQAVPFLGTTFGGTSITPAKCFTAIPLPVQNCPGFNPRGTVTVAVPASGTATTALGFDSTFYVTANAAGTTTVVVSGGPTIAIPESAVVPVFVPATGTITPTYSGGDPPTWVVCGN